MGPGVVCETSMHTHIEIQFALVHTFDMIQLANISPLACMHMTTVNFAMLHMEA